MNNSYNSVRVSNIGRYTHLPLTHNMYMAKPMLNKQTGTGIFSTAASAVTNAAMYLVNKGLDAYSSQTGTKIKNYYGKYVNPSSNYRPGFAGEKHMIDTRGNIMNFCGPGTKIKKRIKRKDPGIDGVGGVDNVCKKHDLAYSNAKTTGDIRRADNRMLMNIKKSKGSKAMKFIASNVIKGKISAEKKGLLDPSKFAPKTKGKGRKKNRDPMYKLKKQHGF